MRARRSLVIPRKRPKCEKDSIGLILKAKKIKIKMSLYSTKGFLKPMLGGKLDLNQGLLVKI